MLNRTEVERLAAAANALRPDWPINSLCTLIDRDHRMRPYRDVAIALAHIATDPATRNPARLAEHGPWWEAAQAGTTNTTPNVGPGREPRCEVYGHDTMPARTCPGCRTEYLTSGTWPAGTRHQEAEPAHLQN